jgi:germination protein M
MNGSTLKSWLISATFVALVAACGDGGSSPASATPTPSATAAPSPSATPTDPGSPAPTAEPTPGQISLKAYFLLFGNVDGPTPLVPVHREVDRTVAVARAAMEQLLAGPTEDERAHDLRVGTIGTQIPEGTRLLGLDVADGIATVDLSGEFASGDIDGDERESWATRLAQVTFTLTQFPTVESVRFLVDGKPGKAIEGHEGSPIDLATRSAYTDQLPGIFIDEPAWGGALADPLIISGIAQVSSAGPPHFEAVLAVRTTDEILAQQTVRADCDAGCWQPPGGGPFEFRMSVPGGPDRDDLLLMVWEVSEDGGQSNALAYPLH